MFTRCEDRKITQKLQNKFLQSTVRCSFHINKLCHFMYEKYFTRLQDSGMRASYMQSNASRKVSFMIIVPSMASFKSVNVFLTVDITRCILSISCFKKMFIGAYAPIFWIRARTCIEERALLHHIFSITKLTTSILFTHYVLLPIGPLAPWKTQPTSYCSSHDKREENNFTDSK